MTAMSPAQSVAARSRLERLLDISREITAVLDLPRLLNLIVQAAAELTECEAASILLIDAPSGELRFEAASNLSGYGLASIPVPQGGSIAGWVTANGQPLVIDDVQHDTRFYAQVDEVTRFSTRSILAVPLLCKAKVIGCLEAVNRRTAELYSEEDLQILTVLAAQAAVAIENARLFQQSDQISEMVHELRTPLTAIVACADMLQHPSLKPEQARELIQTIRGEGMRLSNLANSFLDLARLESGRVRLAQERVNLVGVIRETILLQAPQAQKRGVEILFEPPTAAPHVIGDRDRLKQVMLNLISNAIKYNREHGRIWVRLQSVDHGVEIAVQDSGLGISTDSLPNIFGKFYRVQGTEGYTEGTGLGLSIVKQLVESHGGKVNVESQVNVGTTFTISLPGAPD